MSERHESDVRAATQVAAVEPVWSGQVRAAEVLEDRRVVLHAGPPFADWVDVPAPLRNSLVFAVLLEGWTSDRHAAEVALASGRIEFAPAQDHGVVVPLAGVCSPSMSLHRVIDGNNPSSVKYAVVNEGMVHTTRVGTPADRRLYGHHRWLATTFAQQLSAIAQEPLPLRALMEESLSHGDDCHAVTAAGSRAIAAQLALRGCLDDAGRLFIGDSPAFALNLWMAASAVRLAAAEGTPGSALVTKAAGNGHSFGIQVAGRPDRWYTVPAAPPIGPVDAAHTGYTATGALGDSAVVEFAGYGGMALDVLPERAKALAAIVPGDIGTRPRRLSERAFGNRVSVRCGVSASATVAEGVGPIVLLGMIESTGVRGRIGGGCYEPPMGLFSSAIAALSP